MQSSQLKRDKKKESTDSVNNVEILNKLNQVLEKIDDLMDGIQKASKSHFNNQELIYNNTEEILKELDGSNDDEESDEGESDDSDIFGEGASQPEEEGDGGDANFIFYYCFFKQTNDCVPKTCPFPHLRRYKSSSFLFKPELGRLSILLLYMNELLKYYKAGGVVKRGKFLVDSQT